MEIAIPLIALGGMYVISNQTTKPEYKKQNQNQNQNGNISARATGKKESFANMGAYRNYLPNTDPPPQNYPVSNLNQLTDTVTKYSNPNTATDKYFDQNLYEKRVQNDEPVGNNPQQIYSLTGDYLNSNQFKHNNMVPFYGGKIKGNTFHANTAETQLDNMAGAGSQRIKKIEQAPLFKPQENMSWAHGTPNQSDFFQSRQFPSTNNNNVKPFDTLLVGPGLDQGYGVNGSGGYNSGMEARDKWLPYTVDQLRVDTNPKLEYELINHEGPANAYIKNLGIEGRVEKQRPDTFFINTQDRWLTTTGAIKGDALRPIQETGIIRRPDVVTDYKGPAGATDISAGYAPENFEPSKRVVLPPMSVNHSTAAGKGPSEDGDHFIKSFTNYENNRTSVSQPDTIRSGFSRTIGAVIAPLLDILRPSRKEETSHNVRIYGEATSSVPSSYVINMNDTTPTTIKETTLYSQGFNVNNQANKPYVNNYTSPDLTQRDTTSCNYLGSAGGAASQYGDRSYEAEYRQHNNDIKSATIDNRPNPGGTQIFNQEMNVHISRQDANRYDGRVGIPGNVVNAPPQWPHMGQFACHNITMNASIAIEFNPTY